MTGRYLPDGDIDTCFDEPGAYGRNTDGGWYAVTPNGLLANLAAHTVIQHEDLTITVSPSILVRLPRGDARETLWHGFLERGVWREC